MRCRKGQSGALARVRVLPSSSPSSSQDKDEDEEEDEDKKRREHGLELRSALCRIATIAMPSDYWKAESTRLNSVSISSSTLSNSSALRPVRGSRFSQSDQ